MTRARAQGVPKHAPRLQGRFVAAEAAAERGIGVRPVRYCPLLELIRVLELGEGHLPGHSAIAVVRHVIQRILCPCSYIQTPFCDAAAAGRATRVHAVHASCVPQRRPPPAAQRGNGLWVCVHRCDVDRRGCLAAGEVARLALRWRRRIRCHRAREKHRNTHGAGGQGERAGLSIRRRNDGAN